jgi:hypothetical protein
MADRSAAGWRGDQAKFLKHIDTEKHHYDTFEHDGVTSAIIIEWWKDE